ncbi:MAG: beta propeller domain protein [halophilic archaeon J07HX64]|nr:MAG: beta propeller domain protein [halophilic archaeon J07HX64]
MGVAFGIMITVGVLSVTDTGNSEPETGTPGEDDSQLLPVVPGGQMLNTTAPAIGDTGLEQFGTTEAFRGYVRAGQRRAETGWWRFGQPGVTFEGNATAAPDATNSVAQSSGPDRVAGSNVQVAGLDEPDMVKTDGRNFYYSPSAGRYAIPPRPVEPGTPGSTPVPPWAPSESHVVDVSNPADPSTLTTIDSGGELLQTGDRLVVFNETGGTVVGYDVSDPGAPVESWRLPLDARLVTARETGGQLYVVTQTFVGPETDCPIAPLGGQAVECGAIYGPETQTGADATYTALSIDAESGDIEDSVSVVGTGDNTVVYMSPNGLYLTDTTGVAASELRLSWAEQSEVVPAELAGRLEEIAGYNISERSKQQEMRRAVTRYSSLVNGTTLRESFERYRVAHQENLTQTSIVRIDVEEGRLDVAETGTVPGEPLNQFALDEYQGTLRITTTIPRVAGAESDNHLYVLDNETLDRETRVTGMGHDQRVYSVRYVGDTAYVVTFRQVDPFYVIDFEEPTEPELLSELELPGFSSYLHPADDDHVIGIGKENGQVKSVLFDVTDPTDTAVADQIQLDSFWSAIDESHHAFMIDRRHEVFVLPAGNTAKIIDYADGELEVVREVSAGAEVNRARYVDDQLYIFAGDEIIVLDQTTWERTTTLSVGDG